MPLVSLSTNAKLASEDAKKAFTADFSKVLIVTTGSRDIFCAKTLGKDESYLNVEVSFNPYLMFGGTFEPAFMLRIASLGNTTPGNSQVWAREFSTYFEKNLGVPSNRGLMAFTDPGPAFLGMNGTTAEALRAAPAK